MPGPKTFVAVSFKKVLNIMPDYSTSLMDLRLRRLYDSILFKSQIENMSHAMPTENPASTSLA
jgi:hypothetical protein